MKHTKIKTVRAAILIPEMRHSDLSETQFSVHSKNEGILAFVFCSTGFTGQGKILKGLHLCYNFSASKGGRKRPQCLFFLKEFVV